MVQKAQEEVQMERWEGGEVEPWEISPLFASEAEDSILLLVCGGIVYKGGGEVLCKWTAWGALPGVRK